MLSRLLRKPLAWATLLVLAVGGAAGLYWFQPWKLVADRTVDEMLSDPAPATAPAPSGAPASGPVVLAQGTFIAHEHATSGTARIVQDSGGTRRLELVGLDTSNGPDLRVWITDRPVVEGTAGWRVFDDGAYLELGRLKGNQGDQAYEIPAGVDLGGYRSVSIWCKRFAVSFGAAPLAPA